MRLSRVSVGPRNFLGNNIAYPPQGRTGDNCLLATKVMVPLDGPIREGVGLLGSPAFEIPRSVERDSRFRAQQTDEDLRRSLAGKKRYNLRTMGVFLFVRWLHLLPGDTARHGRCRPVRGADHAVVGAFFALSVVLSAAYYILVERCFTAFRRAEASAVLVLRAVLLVARAPLEGAGRHLSQRLQRNPLQESGLALAGCSTRSRGLRRRVLSDGADPGLHRRPLPCSTPAARSSAIRRRTAPSSPTTRSSVPIARSGSAPSSTTA